MAKDSCCSRVIIFLWTATFCVLRNFKIRYFLLTSLSVDSKNLCPNVQLFSVWRCLATQRGVQLILGIHHNFMVNLSTNQAAAWLASRLIDGLSYGCGLKSGFLCKILKSFPISCFHLVFSPINLLNTQFDSRFLLKWTRGLLEYLCWCNKVADHPHTFYPQVIIGTNYFQSSDSFAVRLWHCLWTLT